MNRRQFFRQATGFIAGLLGYNFIKKQPQKSDADTLADTLFVEVEQPITGMDIALGESCSIWYWYDGKTWREIIPNKDFWITE